VWFERGDYVGFWRRFLIDLVDGFVLLMYWIVAYVVVLLFVPSAYASFVFLCVFGGGVFAYLVLLKYWGRTLGYLVGNARIVNLRGERPSIISLCVRTAFVLLSGSYVLLDIFLLTGDRHRQTLRDKYAQTYVIKGGRKPSGRGRVRYVLFFLLGFNLIHPEVTVE